ncbi:MAG: putative porin [Chthoniobacteraceae bacterium]
MEADLGNGFSAGLRIGTGETNSPVSGNQSLGLAYNGQGGDFSKYAIWLDRGYLKYELASDANHSLGISLGRFDNPFLTSSTIMWADDIGFDGLALTGRYEVTKGVTPFGVLGAFPIFNTDFNFSSNQTAKFKSEDKYLFAAQLGNDWKITKDLSFKAAAGYFDFQNVEGKLSDPYTPLTSSDQGNTDDSRPSFAQKGNTYMALRDIAPNANNGYGASLQYQYYGLASPFRVLALTGRLDYTHYEPLTISLMGDYIKNLAFNGSNISAKAVNNRGDSSSSSGVGSFVGGDTGWFVGMKVGKPSFEKFGDWSTRHQLPLCGIGCHGGRFRGFRLRRGWHQCEGLQHLRFHGPFAQCGLQPALDEPPTRFRARRSRKMFSRWMSVENSNRTHSMNRNHFTLLALRNRAAGHGNCPGRGRRRSHRPHARRPAQHHAPVAQRAK